MIDLQDILHSSPVLLADGATGTNMFAMGLQSGDAPELWNIERPERVEALHRSFIEAGSDIILSNTFGGNRCRLALHKAEHRVEEINAAAVRIAREAAGRAGRTVIVGGSVGPTGELIAPLGELAYDDAVRVFAAQAEALAAGGADVIWLETLSSREELQAAVEGAGSAGLPIISTLSFDTNGSTMMGVTPLELVRFCDELKPEPVACGINCGVGPADVIAGILYITNHDNGHILVAKANCGVPEFVDGAIRYSGTPRIMGDYACLARAAGARIIGGCCGTTAEHVAMMRQVLDNEPCGPRPGIEDLDAQLSPVSEGARRLCLQREPGDGDAARQSARQGRARGRSGRRSRRDTAEA